MSEAHGQAARRMLKPAVPTLVGQTEELVHSRPLATVDPATPEPTTPDDPDEGAIIVDGLV
jgi:hypothetical protein